MKIGTWLTLLGFLALTESVGALAGYITAPEIAHWYAALNKPALNPPNWLFAPVWIALYALMAIAAFRVWRVSGWANFALVLFFVQLALNFAWSLLFFGLHEIAAALGDILALLVLIALTMISFWKIDRVAGLLLTPYFAWVAFATYLNASIYVLNIPKAL